MMVGWLLLTPLSFSSFFHGSQQNPGFPTYDTSVIYSFWVPALGYLTSAGRIARKKPWEGEPNMGELTKTSI